MLLAVIKLSDIGARSFFALVVLYTLPVAASGQFGIALTLISLFSFLSGFERYVDLQRTLVGTTENEVNLRIFAALRFFATNHLACLPLLAVFLHLWAKLTPVSIFLCTVIAVSEHASNEFYRIAMVTRRYRSLILAGTIKNLILLVGAASFALIDSALLNLDLIFTAWALLSAASIGLAAWTLANGYRRCSADYIGIPTRAEQYRRSATHFTIGLAAVLSVQGDRLIAGGGLSLGDSGLYFRHVFLALSIYQVLCIVSFNRVMAGVYSNLKNGQISLALAVIRRQRAVYFILTVLAVLSFFLIRVIPLAGESQVMKSIVPEYLVLLMLAFLVRGVADFNAMVLNGLFREKAVLRAHIVSIASGAATAFFLVKWAGIDGLLFSALLTPLVYLAFTQRYSADALGAQGTRDKDLL